MGPLRRRARRLVKLALGLAGLAGVGAVAVLAFPATARRAEGAGRVFVPTRDDEVLERLPARTEGRRTRELRQLRAALAERPRDAALAVRVARLAIELSRARADPRYQGYAEAALAPLFGGPVEPPTAALTLRATLRQSQHDFPGALADLDRVVARAPDDAQAWLTRAVVLTVLARYPEARAACARLERLAPPVVVAVCRETLASLTGQAAGAYARLSRAAEDARLATPEEGAWVASTLGELAARAGDVHAGRSHLERALELEPGDPYVLAALADLELDAARPAEVVRRLSGKEDNDLLLLRLAIAEAIEHAPGAEAHAALLGERFRASRLRGDVVHRREEARYLVALGDPPERARALELAQANWEVQREVPDARVLMEAALAAKAPAAARPALTWLVASGCEDPALQRLRRELE